MITCQVCQKENPAGAEYCEDCGAALNTPSPTPVGASASPVRSAAASATGTGPTASAAGSVGSLSPEGPMTVADASAPAAASAPTTPADAPPAPTVPPTSSSSSAAASPTAPSSSAASPSTSDHSSPSTGQPASDAQARLVPIRYGAPTGEEIPLFGQRLTVGRFDPETGPVDVDLSNAAESGHISRQHGELYREVNGSWTVRDLGSTNGVFVKSGEDNSFGPRITAPRPLSDGDELAFGNARFIFRTT